MLSLEDALHVRDLYRSLGSLAAVARATGYDPETVKRALGRDYSLPPRRVRSVAIDAPLAELIMANRAALSLNPKNRLTPARAHELLTSAGFSVSLRSVERRFQVVSDRLGTDAGGEAALRLDAPPGAFQVDFGMMSAVISEDVLSLPLLICSSAFSNACAALLCRAQDACNLFWGLDGCFDLLGGVPPLLRFDNLAPAVSMIRRRGRQKTDAFSRFELFHGFESEFCNPAAGWEKGNVENKVQYIRERFFVPPPSAPSLDALNAALAAWCRDDMEREHYAKHRLISDLFQAERGALLPFRGAFDYWEMLNARTDGRGFANYRGNAYFAGERSALRSVVLRASVDNVEIYSQSGDKLAAYPRAYGAGEIIQARDDLARMLSRKPNALGYAGRDRSEGLALRDALRGLDPDARVPFIRQFLDGGRLSDILDAIEAQRSPLFKYNALLQDQNHEND